MGAKFPANPEEKLIRKKKQGTQKPHHIRGRWRKKMWKREKEW